MQYRNLGPASDPLKVSAIALGMMSNAPGIMHSEIDEAAATSTVHTALGAGITLFDTAAVYGDGESERRLGRALKSSGAPRDAYVVATKCSSKTLSAAEIAADCEASLARLGLGHIDLYQIHWFKREHPLEESLAAMDKLRKAGKVRHLGVCNAGPLDTAECLRHVPLVSVQVCYSLLSRGVELGLRDVCLKNGLGVLPYSPLAQGLLTGKYRRADELPVGRARSRHFHKSRPQSRHGEEGFEAETFAAVEAVRGIAAELGVPMSQLAVAWLLAQPVVGSVLCGASRPDQVLANAAGASLTLTPDTLARLDAATSDLKHKLGPNLDPWQGNANSRCR